MSYMNMKRFLLAATLGMLAAVVVWAGAGFNVGMPNAVKRKVTELQGKVQTAIILKGTAAGGNAIAAQTVTAESCNGKSKTATTGADGSFNIDVSALSFPVFLRVSGTTPYYSIAYAAGTANINPYTDLVLKTYYLSSEGIPNLDAAFTANFNSLCSPPPSQSSLNALISLVMNMLSSVMTRNNLDPTTYNPFTTAFAANGAGFDAVLDSTTISGDNVVFSTVTITDKGVSPNVVLSTITPAIHDLSTPVGPTNLGFSGITDSTITLHWTASASTDVAGYGVYRNGALLTNVSTTTFTDKNLASGTSYSYTLDAFNWTGNRSTQTMAQVAATLVLLKVVTVGSGTVTSAPAGINCPATCSADFAVNAQVVLTATGTAGNIFTGWNGAGCSGTSTCTVTLSGAPTVTATFAQPILTVVPAGAGTGVVVSSPTGINCGTTCSASYSTGTVVILTATTTAASIFVGWSGGGCSGISTCTVTMSGSTNTNVTANFTKLYTLTVLSSGTAGTGNGTITSSPAGITNCSGSCSTNFLGTTVATLTATAYAGFGFGGWSGDCHATGPCVLAMSSSHSVTANFLPMGVLQGAVNYTGAYPTPANVSYTDYSTNRISTVTAYPGQVQVFFDTSTTNESAATTILTSLGATLLGKIPLLGYYLAQVSPGAEGTLISNLHFSYLAQVKLALPNIAVGLSDAVVINPLYVTTPMPVPLFINGAMVDIGDSDGHMTQVFQSANDEGLGFADAIDMSAILTNGNISSDKLVTAIVGEAQGLPGSALFINMSNNAGFHSDDGGWFDMTNRNPLPGFVLNGVTIPPGAVFTQADQDRALASWEADIRAKLQAIASLPPNLRANTVMVISSGNNNLDIEPALQRLRLNPVYANILMNNVALCSTHITAVPNGRYPNGAFANHVGFPPGDTDVIFRDNLDAAGGTSFASPACLSDIKQIADQTGVTPTQALLAAKRAATADVNNKLLLSEAIAAAKAGPFMANYSCTVTNITGCNLISDPDAPDADDSSPPTAAMLTPNPITGQVTNLSSNCIDAQSKATQACAGKASISPDGDDLWTCTIQIQTPIAISNCVPQP